MSLKSYSVFNNLFHNLWEVRHFQLVLLFCDIVDGVVRGERYFKLCDNLSGVADGRHPVYGHTRFRLSGSLYGLMHVMTPHAFASEFRQ